MGSGNRDRVYLILLSYNVAHKIYMRIASVLEFYSLLFNY